MCRNEGSFEKKIKSAKKEAKWVLSEAKSKTYEKLCKNLETGETDVYELC